MKNNFDELMGLYDYKVPKILIAQKPTCPSDMAKLLVYSKDDGAVFCDCFLNITEYLPKNAVLVFNETKVLPARLVLTKETGGRVKILYVAKKGRGFCAMADRKLAIGTKLRLNKKIFFTVKKSAGKYYFLAPSFKISALFAVLEKYGQTPIPPYIKNSPLTESELKKKYQAIFARRKGSVAAPTASLHFTKRLLAKIKKAGIGVKFVTLHVNLGTFASLTAENLERARLHKEYYEISKSAADFLNKAKKEGRPIIAVGTTVARTLESAAGDNGILKNLSGFTDLFIREGHKFKFTDGIITNFHVPSSSLLMLVATFISREKLFELYGAAIKRKLRFFSFGDGMLIY